MSGISGPEILRVSNCRAYALRVDIGIAIMRLREKRGLSQKQLGELLGHKGNTTISKWEKGKVTLQRRSIQRLNKIFGVDIEEYARTEGKVDLPDGMKILTGGPSGRAFDLSAIDNDSLATLARLLVRLNGALLAELHGRGIMEDDYAAPGGKPKA